MDNSLSNSSRSVPPAASGSTDGGLQAGASLHQESNSFVRPGLLLFIDQLLVAAGGWIYWLFITRLTTTSEIGTATTFYSLVILTSAITQLGLEYPLLKRSSSPTKILGTVIMLEMILTAASLPIVLLVAGSLYGGSPFEYSLLSIGILSLVSLGFISRFALLGVSDARTVLVSDLIGTGFKFAVGYALVSAGYGGVGILWSFLVYNLVVVMGTLVVAGKRLTLARGSWMLAKEILRDGLTNAPSKLSRIFIMSLSVVLLAFIGVTSDEVGIFYIVLMVSLTVGSFASSMAYMMIPASSIARSDLSSSSMRISLSFTAPLIVALIAQPQFTLSLIGDAYTTAEAPFLILALAILPAAILNNTIAKLNNLNRSRPLVIIGSVQLSVFMLAFFMLSPTYGLVGASLALLLGLSFSTIISFLWSSPRSYSRYIAVSFAAVFVGWLCASILTTIFPAFQPIGVILASVSACLVIVFGLKNSSIREIKSIARLAARGHDQSGNEVHVDQNETSVRATGKNENYLLLGNYGNYNIGDEILLRAVVTDISKATHGNAKFFVPTRNVDFVKVYHKTYSDLIMPVKINQLLGLLKTFLKCDTIVVGGGGIWSGYTGPLAHLIPIVALAGKCLRKHVEFRAIGLYSTASPIDRILANFAILVSDSCSVRDDESHDMLWNMNRTKAQKVDDLAIQYLRTLTVEELNTARKEFSEGTSLGRNVLGKIVVGISVKPVKSNELNAKIVAEFSEVMKALNSKYPGRLHFVFFPFAKTHSRIESDEQLAQNIIHRVKLENITVLEHTDPVLWFIAIKDFVDVFVGMRLHSVVFASEAGKPILCIPYERKVLEFLRRDHRSNDVSALSVDCLKSSDIADFVDENVKRISVSEAQ